MAYIIRMQNLSDLADSRDIRNFFVDINIPAGGVVIVGGSDGEAFITCATERDFECALSLNEYPLLGQVVKLESMKAIASNKRHAKRSGRHDYTGSSHYVDELRQSSRTASELYRDSVSPPRRVEDPDSYISLGVRYPGRSSHKHEQELSPRSYNQRVSHRPALSSNDAYISSTFGEPELSPHERNEDSPPSLTAAIMNLRRSDNYGLPGWHDSPRREDSGIPNLQHIRNSSRYSPLDQGSTDTDSPITVRHSPRSQKDHNRDGLTPGSDTFYQAHDRDHHKFRSKHDSLKSDYGTDNKALDRENNSRRDHSKSHRKRDSPKRDSHHVHTKRDPDADSKRSKRDYDKGWRDHDRKYANPSKDYKSDPGSSRRSHDKKTDDYRSDHDSSSGRHDKQSDRKRKVEDDSKHSKGVKSKKSNAMEQGYIVASNIALTTTARDLRTFFTGHIAEGGILMKVDEAHPETLIAYIKFLKRKDAVIAESQNGTLLHGCHIKINIVRPDQFAKMQQDISDMPITSRETTKEQVYQHSQPPAGMFVPPDSHPMQMFGSQGSRPKILGREGTSPPGSFGPQGPPPQEMFAPLGPHPGMFGPQGPPLRPAMFGPQGPHPSVFGSQGPPPPSEMFGPRGPPPHPEMFGPRGPPSHPEMFGPRGPPSHPRMFGPQGPPPHPRMFGPQGPPPHPEMFGTRGPPPHPRMFGPQGPTRHASEAQYFDTSGYFKTNLQRTTQAGPREEEILEGLKVSSQSGPNPVTNKPKSLSRTQQGQKPNVCVVAALGTKPVTQLKKTDADQAVQKASGSDGLYVNSLKPSKRGIHEGEPVPIEEKTSESTEKKHQVANVDYNKQKTLVLVDIRGVDLLEYLKNEGLDDVKTHVQKTAGIQEAVSTALPVIKKLRPANIVILNGICDLTHRCHETKKAIVRCSSVQEGVAKYMHTISEAYDAISRVHKAKIIFAPIIGIDLKNSSVPSTQFTNAEERRLWLEASMPHPQQRLLDNLVVKINQKICSFNTSHFMPTPWISSCIHNWKYGNTFSHCYSELLNGVHLPPVHKRFCAKQIADCITNKGK